MNAIKFILILSLISLVSCKIDHPSSTKSLVAISTFENDVEGWIPSYADYPLSSKDSFNFDFKFSSFQSSSGTSHNAARQSAYCENGQLFTYIKKQLVGFEPNTTYNITFNIQIYTSLTQAYDGGDLEDNSKGSFLKVGAFTDEPVNDTIDDSSNPGEKLIVTDFDKGMNGSSGADMLYLSKLDIIDINASPVVDVAINDQSPVIANSDSDGKMWMVVGFDTNVPIHFSAYYTYIGLQFDKVSAN